MKKITLSALFSLILILTGCGIMKNFYFMLSSPVPNYKDFPLGKQKNIVIDLKKSYIKKPYVISLKTEFIGGAKIPSHQLYRELNYPFELEVKGYKKERDSYSLILHKKINQHTAFTVNGADTSDNNNYAFVQKFHFELSSGEYRFEIKDNSEYIEKFKEIETSIDIFVDIAK